MCALLDERESRCGSEMRCHQKRSILKYKALNSTKLKVLDRIMNAVKVVQGRSQASRREGSVDVG